MSIARRVPHGRTKKERKIVKISRHSRQRITKRPKFKLTEFQAFIDQKRFVPVGRLRGGDKPNIHYLLIWSVKRNDWFVVIYNATSRKVVTVRPLGSRWQWLATDELYELAKRKALETVPKEAPAPEEVHRSSRSSSTDFRYYVRVGEGTRARLLKLLDVPRDASGAMFMGAVHKKMRARLLELAAKKVPPGETASGFVVRDMKTGLEETFHIKPEQ